MEKQIYKFLHKSVARIENRNLNEWFTNPITIPGTVIVEGMEHNLKSFQPSDYFENKDLRTHGNCLIRIFKIENIEWVAIYKPKVKDNKDSSTQDNTKASSEVKNSESTQNINSIASLSSGTYGNLTLKF